MRFTRAKVARMFEEDGQLWADRSVDLIVHDQGKYMVWFISEIVPFLENVMLAISRGDAD